MIYVVEIPYVHPAKVWAAADAEAFFRMIEVKRPRCEGYVYARATARQLLTESAETADVSWILQLAIAHGWDTPLYRADYLVSQVGWSPTQLDKFNAYMAALVDDLAGCVVFTSTAAAQAALADSDFWIHHGGIWAQTALYELLP